MTKMSHEHAISCASKPSHTTHFDDIVLSEFGIQYAVFYEAGVAYPVKANKGPRPNLALAVACSSPLDVSCAQHSMMRPTSTAHG
jgi:hypothetical protein